MSRLLVNYYDLVTDTLGLAAEAPAGRSGLRYWTIAAERRRCKNRRRCPEQAIARRNVHWLAMHCSRDLPITKDATEICNIHLAAVPGHRYPNGGTAQRDCGSYRVGHGLDHRDVTGQVGSSRRRSSWYKPCCRPGSPPHPRVEGVAVPAVINSTLSPVPSELAEDNENT